MDVAPHGALADPPEFAACLWRYGAARSGQTRRETVAIAARRRNAVALAIAAAWLRHISRRQTPCASELAVFWPAHCCAGATENRRDSAQRVCDWTSVAEVTGVVDCYGSTSRPGLDAMRCGDVLWASRHRGALLEAHTLAVRTPLTAHRAQRPCCDCGCVTAAAAAAAAVAVAVTVTVTVTVAVAVAVAVADS